MITVLRLGHRVARDARVSTHCGLVARAFGALSIIYTGDHDDKMAAGINGVTQRFGGPFAVGYSESWRRTLSDFKKRKFTIVHLTVYGMPLEKKIRSIRKRKNILVVIGGEKVPPEIYEMADYNISVTSQPHSEVAALALFLHEYFSGKELSKKFKNAKLRIVPQERGKKVVG